MCLAISLDVSSNECVTIAHTLIKPCNDAVSCGFGKYWTILQHRYSVHHSYTSFSLTGFANQSCDHDVAPYFNSITAS